ncbi:MAG TPA: phosphatidate cytidylyltransferase [Ferrovibrio sp.]|uniref:phosphatidate cytidylyltransferase n=1 Tax=Ferrovibrio sp. TaxID=1917215 RepID=UPI002B4B13B4|nr:phosphatidate cytidylyltransferase [Ferrovibrio sp.]HLT79311.1 phosphatidate cytidylyltransferase [Ferrovibrio sp.]
MSIIAVSGAMAAAVSDGTPRPKSGGLKLRILSAAVMLPVAVGATWLGGWFFAALIALAGVAMLWEWARLPGELAMNVVVTGSLALVAALYLCLSGDFGWSAVLIALAAVVVGFLQRHRFVWHAAGFIYIGLPCIVLLWLREIPDHGLLVVFWLLVVVWATDIGAYAAGRTIGGPKLIPAISPNKTWAGLFGGMLSAGIAGGLLALIDPRLPSLPLAVFGALLAVVAQAGDFTESAVKRRFGVKDSSHLIPGHGGVLDRVDGLLFAAPVLALALLLWRDRLWM